MYKQKYTKIWKKSAYIIVQYYNKITLCYIISKKQLITQLSGTSGLHCMKQ